MRSVLISFLFFSVVALVQAVETPKFPVVERAKIMVDNLLVPQGGLTNERVLDAIRRIPRHQFVPAAQQQLAYWDQAVAIGNAQTISPPYIVAYMTEQLDPKPADKVLEIGTGSGYQAAVLSLLVKEVYSIEIVEPLGKSAEQLLKTLKMDNVHIKIGDGYKGWTEAAPFDSIIVTCSPESVPQPLIDQLKEGGRMIIPLGERFQQQFYLCKKQNGTLVKEHLTPALFVPMTGEAEAKRQIQPDGKNPAIRGGDFAKVREDGTPDGWHYARNVKIVSGAAHFTSVKPLQKKIIAPQESAQLLQGFAVDGQSVSKIKIDYRIRGKKIWAVQGPVLTHTGYLTQFDENRNVIAEVPFGRCTGTFDWQNVSQEIDIKPETSEAVLLIGIPVATGELDVMSVSVQKTAAARLP